MAERLRPWRTKPTQVVVDMLQQLSSRVMYLVHRMGPTSFLVRDEGCEHKRKVTIGSQPHCTCGGSKGCGSQDELCIHLLFVMIKVLRVPASNPLVWQLSLTDRELDEVLHCCAAVSAMAHHAADDNNSRTAADKRLKKASDEGGTVQRRSVEEEEPCPICYEDMTDQQDLGLLVWCKSGCGRNVHGRCMRVWAEHQTQTLKKELTCPLCRSEWGEFSWRPPVLPKKKKSANRQADAAAVGCRPHPGTTCGGCKKGPISGKLYKCLICPCYDLCDACFVGGHHPQHPFAAKSDPTAFAQAADRPDMMPSAAAITPNNRSAHRVQAGAGVEEQDNAADGVLNTMALRQPAQHMEASEVTIMGTDDVNRGQDQVTSQAVQQRRKACRRTTSAPGRRVVLSNNLVAEEQVAGSVLDIMLSVQPLISGFTTNGASIQHGVAIDNRGDTRQGNSRDGAVQRSSPVAAARRKWHKDKALPRSTSLPCVDPTSILSGLLGIQGCQSMNDGEGDASNASGPRIGMSVKPQHATLSEGPHHHSRRTPEDQMHRAWRAGGPGHGVLDNIAAQGKSGGRQRQGLVAGMAGLLPPLCPTITTDRRRSASTPSHTLDMFAVAGHGVGQDDLQARNMTAAATAAMGIRNAGGVRFNESPEAGGWHRVNRSSRAPKAPSSKHVQHAACDLDIELRRRLSPAAVKAAAAAVARQAQAAAAQVASSDFATVFATGMSIGGHIDSSSPGTSSSPMISGMYAATVGNEVIPVRALQQSISMPSPSSHATSHEPHIQERVSSSVSHRNVSSALVYIEHEAESPTTAANHSSACSVQPQHGCLSSMSTMPSVPFHAHAGVTGRHSPPVSNSGQRRVQRLEHESESIVERQQYDRTGICSNIADQADAVGPSNVELLQPWTTIHSNPVYGCSVRDSVCAV